MIKHLRLSQFVSLLRKGQKHYLYNSINGGLITISEEIVHCIQQKGKDLFYVCEKEDDFFTYLQDNRYIADEVYDKDIINILRYRKLKASFYIIGTDKFSDERCLECKLLPICNGGCSRYRFGDDYKTTDQCPLNESEIINFMV